MDKYIDDSKCGWCRKNARKIRDAAKELRAASPAALDITKQFQDKVGKTTALDGLDEQKKDLSAAAERNRDFKERLNKVLEEPRERVQKGRPFGPRSKRTTTAKPEKRGPPLFPGLPGFVTPDEVGQERDEDLERYRAEGNRRTGPIREKFRLRVWKRMEGQ